MFGGNQGNFYAFTGNERLNSITKWGLINNSIVITQWNVDGTNAFKENRVQSIGYMDNDKMECASFKLETNEYINSHKTYKRLDLVSNADVICGIKFGTNMNRTFECVSNDTRTCNETSGWIIYSDQYLSGFFGRISDSKVTSIGYNMNPLPYPLCVPGIINNNTGIECSGKVIPKPQDIIGDIIILDYISSMYFCVSQSI